MNTIRDTGAVLLLSSLAVVGCESGDAADDAVVVRDSAGIRIVESDAPRWTERTRWRIESEPVVDLGGGMNPGEPYLYQRIIGVMRLNDGRLLVADGQAAELRFYDSGGRHLETVGRRGGGPGEMRVAYDIWRRQGDTLVINSQGGELHEFTSSGEYVRRWRPPVPDGVSGPFMSTDLVLGDGSVVLSQLIMVSVIQGRAVRTNELDSTDRYVVASAAEPRLLLRHPSRLRVDGRPPVFSPSPILAAGHHHVVFALPSDFEIRWYATDGRLERIHRRSWDPVPVADAAKDAYRESSLAAAERAPPQLQAGRRRQIAEAIFASHFSPFDRMLVDRAGNLWVRLSRTDGITGTRDVATNWSVFDTSGAWLGELTMPRGLDVREIGDDYVTGVWLDDLEVQHARLYELIKP